MRFGTTVLVLLCFVGSVLCADAQQSPWVMQKTGVKASLRGLSVANDKVIWASGSGGTFLRTTDGGDTWSAGKVAGAEELDFRGVKAWDANTAVLMSSGPAEQGRARIYRTEDGGANWKLAFSTETKGVFLDAVAFWDWQHGIAIGDPVGGYFYVITTDDGGRTWRESPRPQIPEALPKEGAYAASNSCLTVQGRANAWFVTGGAGAARAIHSTDRGRTWRVTTTPVKADTASSGLFSVAFRDARNGVAVGGDYRQPTASATTVAITHDGGKSWKLASAAAPRLFLSGVVWVGKDRLIGVGSSGWAQSNDGGEHWTKGGDEGFNVVAVAPSGEVWAAGAQGEIALSRQPSGKQ